MAAEPVTHGAGLALARRRPLDRLQLRADPAQDRGRRGHRLGRDHHRGDPLGDRPDRLDRRLLLRPPGRDARRLLPPLRAREVRERRRRRRGDADPRRLRRDRLHRGQPPGRGHRDRVDRLRHRGRRVRHGRQPRSSPTTSTGAPARPTRPPSPATPPTSAPTPTRRSACSSASAWSSSPARRGSTPSSRSLIAVAIVYTGLRVVAGSWRVLVDEALPGGRDRRHPRGDRGFGAPRRGRLPRAAHPPRGPAPLRRRPRPVPLRHHARGRARDRPRAAGHDPRQPPRRRRPHPPRAGGPRPPGRGESGRGRRGTPLQPTPPLTRRSSAG